MSHLRIIKMQTDSRGLGQDLIFCSLTGSQGMLMLLAYTAHLE